MKTTNSVLLLLCALTLTAAARIGDTEAECESKYGAPHKAAESALPPATVAKSFVQGGWGMLFHFWNGRAAALTYMKIDRSAIAYSESQRILDSYGAGQRWMKDSSGTFQRSDGQMLASVDTNSITIYTKELHVRAVLKQIVR